MKRPLAACAAAALLLGIPAAPAAAATPTQRIAKLERQVRTLQRQNRTLTRQVREARELGIAAGQVAICATAITADAFQSTWTVIDQVAQRTIFGPQSPLQEPVCSGLRVARPQPVPPSVSPFASLLRFFNQPLWGLSAVFR